MSKGTILVIDDEKDLTELVRYNLEKEGFDVIGTPDGESGLEVAHAHRPDLVLLDLMLPGMDGLEVCRRLRAESRTSRVPVIMLTARASEADRVVGLEFGADDYLVKPFSPRELAARIKAVLRRCVAAAADPEEVLQRGDLTLDCGRHEVRHGDRKVDLTAAEFRVLQFLMTRPGRVFSRSEIIDAALGKEDAVLDRTVDVHVTAIRRKLGAAGDRVETVRSVGYRFRE